MISFISITDYGHGGYKVTIVASVLILMQFLMVGGRLLSRNLQKAALAIDDYALFLATAMGVGLCALAIAFPRIASFGPLIGVIEETSESQGRMAGQSFVAWTILYGFSIAISKCAILLLYTRIFTSRMRMFTALSSVVAFVIVATCIANTVVAIFSCSPVYFAWDKSMQGGQCIDQVAFARFMSIPNVITGAVMLVMPLPLVWNLNVAIAAKIALTATFLHGIIGFIASCARLSILFQSGHATSVNTNVLAWTIWTINEPANYVIAACLPTLRPVFLRILPPSFFVLSKQSVNKKSYTSNVKVSWPRGSSKPKFRLETAAILMTDCDLTGPWNITKINEGVDAERDIGLAENPEMLTSAHISSFASENEIGAESQGRGFEEHVVEFNARDNV